MRNRTIILLALLAYSIIACTFVFLIGSVTVEEQRRDVAAILVVPCDTLKSVIIFTHPDGTWDSLLPTMPPSQELIQRLERTKRSQINLPCLQETLNVQIP